MVFIIVLIIAATTIAGAAAFFSVYGLAFTFSGTFWSVVVMGASLELGKLVAASYLYRYWEKTHQALKWYLMFGVAALMILTSTGIFGYLSSGYQTDVLPLKQAEEQVKILDEEKIRLIARKTQIDTQIAQLPQNSVRGRTQLIKGFKDEQATVTARISELDKEILANKTKLIQTQAHIGPITYIASAFGLDSDNATKYLIYLIIFAFDPMAVALTLAVNTALKLRREEQEEEERLGHEERMRRMQLEHEERLLAEKFLQDKASVIVPESVEPPLLVSEDADTSDNDADNPAAIDEPTPIATDIFIQNEDHVDFNPEQIEEEPATDVAALDVDRANQLDTDFSAAEDALSVTPPVVDLPPPQQRHYRPYSGLWNGDSVDIDLKLTELVSHYNWLKQRRGQGEELSRDELWEFQAIEDVLKKHGYNIYL